MVAFRRYGLVPIHYGVRTEKVPPSKSTEVMNCGTNEPRFRENGGVYFFNLVLFFYFYFFFSSRLVD